MPDMYEKIKMLSGDLRYDTKEFYEKSILGQQVYSVVLYSYLFLTVDQDSGICGKLVRQVPKEKLLKLYLHEMRAEDIWNSQEFGILHKIRRSFAVLGIHYQNFGYDSVYSAFKSAVHSFFDEFLQHPVTDYTHLLESYAWNHHHAKTTYAVKEEHRFSDKDAIFRASTTFFNKRYYEVGYSKKNAIENLACLIANTVITPDHFNAIANSQNCGEIERNEFVFNVSDYEDADERVRQFAEQYGVEQFLMRFSLLSRSQMGKNVWARLGISLPAFLLETRVSRLKKALISLGQEFILLQLLDFNLRNNGLQAIDIRSLDQTTVNIGPDEVHELLLKMLRVTDITAHLFDYMATPATGSLTLKEKGQIADGVMAAFLLSNFAPDKKFAQHFNNFIETVYAEVGIDAEIDYRFATIAFLSALNVRVKTNHHELRNGIFHAELVVGEGANAPTYICENESMRAAKKDVWKVAYDDIVRQIRNFFYSPNSNCTNRALLLFAKGVTGSRVISNDFYLDFGILNAKNFPQIELTSFSKIINRLKSILGGAIVNNFLEVVYKANEGLYIQIEDSVYSYSSWLKSLVLSNGSKLCLSVNEARIAEIYDHIVNPSLLIQKKLIDSDYKLVRKIYPLSDDIAKYAIDVNFDAYNYLQFVSAESAAYFAELKKEEEQLSNVGTLTVSAGNETSIVILDSHKPFHTQIEGLVEKINIQRVTFACGYCFASGLSLFRNLIDHTLFSGVPFELYIGALQRYDESSLDDMITGIDKTTVRSLNSFLSNSNVSLFTCVDRFYHGKLYILEGETETVICMGSSNISRSAFITNYELNVVFKTKTGSELFNSFTLWAQQLKRHSKELKYLDESMFGDNEMKQDGSVHLTRVSLESMKTRISELSNAEVQYRLNLWMSYSPDIVAENLGIPALPNYFIFVYREERLIVFESFEAGNAYFCIRYDDSFEDVINNILTFSKSEIFEYSQMTKRGYHVQNKFTLANNIRWYFRKECRK